MTPSKSQYQKTAEELANFIQEYTDYQRHEETMGEDDDVQANLFVLYDDYETWAFIGMRDDNNYIDIIWEFDVLPAVSSSFSEDMVERILDQSERDRELSEYPHQIAKQIDKLYRSDEEFDTSDIDIDDSRIAFDADDESVDITEKLYDQFYAAILALEGLSDKKSDEIAIKLERVFVNHPVSFQVKTTEQGALQGFKISYQFHPYETENLRKQELHNTLQTVLNLGRYGEKFLKYTFDAQDSSKRGLSEDHRESDMNPVGHGDFNSRINPPN